MKKYLFIAIAFFSFSLYAQNNGIIPTPKNIEFGTSELKIKNTNLIITIIPDQFKNVPQIDLVLNQLLMILEKDYQTISFSKNKKTQPFIIEINNYGSDKIPNSNPEGYIVSLQDNRISISAISSKGIFYAIQSLKQLFKFHATLNKPIYNCKILDYPSLPMRGWMDDINRGPIPSVAFIKKEIETLSEYKLNFFNLYTESVFKSTKFPDIAPFDGLTPAEIADIQQFAELYFVEFIPNQQAFGHMEKLLANPFYQDLGDDTHILNPGDPKTYAFLESYLTEISSLYDSKYFNINCDETEALGNGRAKKYVAEVGKSQAYINHILKVYDILKKQNKRVMLWADIIGKDTAMVNQFPKDIIPIFWAYHAASDFNNGLLPLKNSGLQFLVAPGTSSWGTILPDYETYTQNIAVLVRDGYLNGAKGMLNTSWDDSGESLFQSLWHAHAWGAEISWNPCLQTDNTLFQNELKNRLTTFNQNFSVLHFGIDGYISLVQKVKQMEQIVPEGISAFHNSWKPLLKMYPSQLTKSYDSLNEVVIKNGLLLKVELKHYKEQCLSQNDDIDFLIYVVDRFVFNAQKNRTRLMLDDKKRDYFDDFMEKNKENFDVLHTLIFDLKKSYIHLWERECRGYYLETNLKKYDQVAKEIQEIPYTVRIMPINVATFDSFVLDKSKMSPNIYDLKIFFQTLPGFQKIYYTFDGSTPNKLSKKSNLFNTFDKTCLVKTVVYDSLDRPHYNEQFVIQHFGVGSIEKLNTNFSNYKPEYSGGSKFALGDGILGSNNFSDGLWQGYQGVDISLDYNFGYSKNINAINARFVQNCVGWIQAPDTLEIYTSLNGTDFTLYQIVAFQKLDEHQVEIIEREINKLNITTQYLRLVYINKGVLPYWHSSAGADSYLFCDEIILK